MKTINLCLAAFSLIILVGCGSSKRSNNTEQINTPDIAQEVKYSSNKLTTTEIVDLHTSMYETIESVSVNNELIYLDPSGVFNKLIVTELHPEVFISSNKNHAVLCVTAADTSGNTYPVDVYAFRSAEQKPHVYDIRIGEADRKILMALMERGIYHKI